tara:strand:+ start:3868 stop:4164 length:297 start_codon:yes stop_codon:yes gene_type:complete
MTMATEEKMFNDHARASMAVLPKAILLLLFQINLSNLYSTLSKIQKVYTPRVDALWGVTQKTDDRAVVARVIFFSSPSSTVSPLFFFEEEVLHAFIKT